MKKLLIVLAFAGLMAACSAPQTPDTTVDSTADTTIVENFEDTASLDSILPLAD